MCFSCNNTSLPIFTTRPFDISLDDSWEPKGISKKVENSKYMIPKPYLIMRNVRVISSCIHRCAAIDNDDILWVWGANSIAQMNGVFSNDFPQNIQRSPQKTMENVLDVSCGGWHTLCITKDNNLWGWGENGYGQLGVGDIRDRNAPTFIMDKVVSIFANEYQSFAIREDHTLWGWGFNQSKTLLDDSKYLTTPKLLMNDVTRVSASSCVVAAIKQGGFLWMWGSNTHNTLFTKPQFHFYEPTLLMTDVVDISLPSSENSEFALATGISGDLYGFGNLQFLSKKLMSIYKQQGNKPLKLMRNVSSACAGNNFIFIEDLCGRTFALGHNEVGQCGTGKSSDVIREPIHIMTHVQQMAAGHCHGLGLQTNGDVWIWGGDYGMRE